MVKYCKSNLEMHWGRLSFK